MNPIQAVIIDDEAPARERVRFVLKGREDIIIAGEAENGQDGIELIEKEKPQLVFLDIQMPKLDGFGMLGRCSYIPAVVFISAYDEYAIQAFNVNAVDYLLKPYTKERFDAAVAKVLSSLQSRNQWAGWEEKISRLIEAYRQLPASDTMFLEQITVRDRHTFKIFDTGEIDFFRIDDGLLYLYHAGARYMVDTPLNNLESRLSPHLFLRVHRNSLVNIKRIEEVIPWGNSRLVLNFGKSGKVHVSRDNIRLLKERIGIRL
ncbi:MAG: LytTR family DNA-binding domain-containing protein [Spirochaetia bacterium]|nr:LytTR family DNA-binding domain-containing protein [Spirochaetia bacterium]